MQGETADLAHKFRQPAIGNAPAAGKRKEEGGKRKVKREKRKEKREKSSLGNPWPRRQWTSPRRDIDLPKHPNLVCGEKVLINV